MSYTIGKVVIKRSYEITRNEENEVILGLNKITFYTIIGLKSHNISPEVMDKLMPWNMT